MNLIALFGRIGNRRRGLVVLNLVFFIFIIIVSPLLEFWLLIPIGCFYSTAYVLFCSVLIIYEELYRVRARGIIYNIYYFENNIF